MRLARDGQPSVSAILVLIIAMIVRAVADPLPSVHHPDIRGLTPSRGSPDVAAMAPAAMIEKRAIFYHNYQAFNGYNVYYSMSRFNSILPIAAAVSSLLDFYVTVAEHAAPNGQWRQFNPAGGHFRATYGHYELDIVCENREISWSLVYNFAYFMAHQTNRGFLATYTALISYTAQEIDLHVRFRVRQG